MNEPRVELDERDIRVWFCKADLDQALDTFRVVEGILQARQEAQPVRKRRRDAGKPREQADTLPGMEGANGRTV